jgi:cell division protein FtsN
MSADCDGRKVRLGETTGYPQRNLLGERKMLRPAETDWRTPEPGTALENAWRAACESEFRGPFQAAGVKIARTDQPPAAQPAAAAAAAPPRAVPPPPAAGPAPRPAAPPAAPAPSRGGAVSVQVGAFADQGEAAKIAERLAAGRPRIVEQAVVGGRTWYRAVVAGFASVGDAQQFCAARKAAGGVCFVRGR